MEKLKRINGNLKKIKKHQRIVKDQDMQQIKRKLKQFPLLLEEIKQKKKRINQLEEKIEKYKDKYQKVKKTHENMNMITITAVKLKKENKVFANELVKTIKKHEKCLGQLDDTKELLNDIRL